jgi:type IV secretory pathway TraG/TraD family ATPase VirD4
MWFKKNSALNYLQNRSFLKTYSFACCANKFIFLYLQTIIFFKMQTQMEHFLRFCFKNARYDKYPNKV